MAPSPGASRPAAWLVAVCALALAACTDDSPPPIDPETRAEGLYIHGTTLYLQGKFDEAILAFKEMEKLKPGDPRLPAAYGEIYLSQGKLKDALEQFEIAAQKDPRRSTNWSRIGFIKLQLGIHEEARSALRKAIALNPMDHVALEALAELDLQEGRLDEAVSHFTLAADASLTAETGGQLLVRAARELQKAGRDEEALKLLQSAAGRGSPSVDVLTELGELLIKSRRFEDAVGVLTQAAQRNRADPMLWELVGELYVSLDKPGDAIAAFKESLKVKDRAVVHVALARIHRARDDMPAANEELELALQTATGEEEREALELARLLSEFNRKKDALSILDALAQEPDNAADVAIHLELAKLAKQLGATEKVTVACKRVLAADAGVGRCPP